jgi:hypothetical protein
LKYLYGLLFVALSLAVTSMCALADDPANFNVMGLHLYESPQDVVQTMKQHGFIDNVGIRRVGCQRDVLAAARKNPTNVVIDPKCVGWIYGRNAKNEDVTVYFIEDYPSAQGAMRAIYIQFDQPVTVQSIPVLKDALVSKYGQPTTSQPLPNTLNELWCQDDVPGDCQTAAFRLAGLQPNLPGSVTQLTMNAETVAGPILRAIFAGDNQLQIMLFDQHYAVTRSNAIIVDQNKVLKGAQQVDL